MADYDRTDAASPSFRWANTGTISAGGEEGFSWEIYNTASRKYLPFNFTRIINNSSSPIIVYPNTDRDRPLDFMNGTITSLDRTFLPSFTGAIIHNNGSNDITAGQVVISNSREAVTTDTIVARLHRRLMSQKIAGRKVV